LSNQSKLEGGGTDSFGRREPRRQYVSDPCRASRGGSGGDVDGERVRRSPRFIAADTDDDGDGGEEPYIFRDWQPGSLDDEGSVQSDVIVDGAQPGDVVSADTPSVTMSGTYHVCPPHATSSISSGTGNQQSPV